MKTRAIPVTWLGCLLLALAGALTGCATGTQSSAYPVETRGPYALDTGDTVRVTVYGEEQLSNTYRVDDSGALALPLVGAIQVRGQTTKAATAKVRAALASGYLRDPDVAIEVAEYRPFFIQGEVGNSGQYPYVYGMTVRAAIATAGGFSEVADRDRALLYRRQGNRMVRGRVDLDFPIYPGDTIVIQERWF